MTLVEERTAAPVQVQACDHVTDVSPTCWRCGRVLAGRMTRPWDKDCERCKASNKRDAESAP